jgi:hypothetical protein
MDTVDKIIQHLAGDDIEISREQVVAKVDSENRTPEDWLAQLEGAAERVNDPEYMKADPTGVVDMEKFSAPLSVHLVKGNSTD